MKNWKIVGRLKIKWEIRILIWFFFHLVFSCLYKLMEFLHCSHKYLDMISWRCVSLLEIVRSNAISYRWAAKRRAFWLERGTLGQFWAANSSRWLGSSFVFLLILCGLLFALTLGLICGINLLSFRWFEQLQLLFLVDLHLFDLLGNRLRLSCFDLQVELNDDDEPVNVEEHIQEECEQIDEEESLEDVAVEEGLVVGRTQIDRVDGDGEDAQDCNRLVDEPPENALTICL